ncbi:MAG: diphthine--ammonia ligase [Candidatus Aenigmarchaeota archaeon]|nr:diphthine--ammonia ligase [Candidatus Aenigmarchaeota archaeon]
MRVAVLFSGGKDSTFATHVALQQGWDVRYLVTLLPKRNDSYMFHHPCAGLTTLQAEAMGIKHVVKETAGEKEKELEDMTAALKSVAGEVDGVLSGAIASRYQKDRVDAVCKDLGLRSIAPLWGKDQHILLKDEIAAGLQIVMTAVAAEGLDARWLGRKIDNDAANELALLHTQSGINIAGEGGEYETFVTDAPFFRKRVDLGAIEKIWDADTASGYIICKDAKIVSK